MIDMTSRERKLSRIPLAFVLAFCIALSCHPCASQEQFELNDVHFNLTNSIHKGTDIH